jgi:two-component system alkaline phosphatase synthesis response regulator PhoP
MPTILVIEDEPQIVEILRDYLLRSGFRVVAAGDGPSGLGLARRESPDLVVLDLMLPGAMDGLDVCRQLRREKSHSMVPIIMLTARVEETDRLIGLELGADDYVTKPFSPREVVARVRAVLRRTSGSEAAAAIVQVADLEIDREYRQVRLAGQPVELTPTEFDLLATLATQPGRPFTREELTEQVYDAVYTSFDRAVDSHIKNLRRKIETDPGRPEYILTTYGVGYRLNDRPAAAAGQRPQHG